MREFLAGSATLEVDAQGVPSSSELQLATAALLWEMANADNEYHVEEYSQILESLVEEFGLDQDAAKHLIESAQAISSRPNNIDKLIDTINKHFSLDQKQILFSMVWRVAKGDGKIEEIESAFTAQLRNRLGLKLADWARAIALARSVGSKK